MATDVGDRFQLNGGINSARVCDGLLCLEKSAGTCYLLVR
jgi:hypothetical protein